MMRNHYRRLGLTILFGLAIAALCAACDTGGEVRLIPVYPADEGNLLDKIDVDIKQLKVELFASDKLYKLDPVPIKTEVLLRGEPLKLDGLAEGPWTLALHGLNDTGFEVVYGKTHPFRIAPSTTTEVRVFMGRLNAFNFVALEPADVAASINGLRGHAATPFRDEDGKQWILVTGGYTPGPGGIATADAYLIDPSNFTAAKLDATMSKERTGHTAIAVEPPGRAPVVVIADGDSAPISSLDVFDTATGEFRTIDVPCGPADGAGVVPALVRDERGELVPSGRVILPGAELCVVDPYGESEAETWPSPTGEAPTPPALSASNAAGQLIVVDGEGAVWVDSTVERTDVTGVCEVGAASVWRHLAPRVGGVLTAVGARDRFAVIGGKDPDGIGRPSSDWATISLSGCDVREVVEGDSGRTATDPVADPVVLDLSSADTAPVVDLLITGSTEAAEKRSVVLIGDSAENVPLWYEEVEGHTPLLRAAREDHAVAVLENRSAWVIGGSDGQEGWAEIFEIGEAVAPLGADTHVFAPRKPVLTTMTVLDETEEAKDLLPLIDNEDEDGLLAHLFGLQTTAQTNALVYLVGNENRGIGDGLDVAEIDLEDNGSCAANPVSAPTDIGWVVMGDTTGIVVPEGVNPANDDDEAILDAQQAILNAMSGVKTTSLSDWGDDGAVPLGPYDPNPSTTCQWRQYVRVGFDGLGFEGTEKDATYSGVNVLLWIVSGDDCSQGVYGASDLSVLEELISSGEITDSTSCFDMEMDPYFKLPPDGLQEQQDFENIVNGLVWDPKDLIIGLIGQRGTVKQEDPYTPVTNWGLPRRLEAVAELLSVMGAEIVPMFIDDVTDEEAAKEAFSEELEVLADRIAVRNPNQVCVPDALVGGFDANFVPSIGDHGLFEPLSGSDTAISAGIGEQIGKKCRAFRAQVQGSQATDNGPTYTRVVGIDESLEIGVDTDRRAGCARGWTVSLDSRNDQLFPGTRYLQCIIGD